MTELFWIGALTAAATLLGAAVGSLSNIFGPVWQERRRADRDALRSESAARQDAALAFMESLAALFRVRSLPERLDVEQVRMRFVSVLRPGEIAADAFTYNLMNRVQESKQKPELGDIIQVGGSMLFSWLRGDLPIDRLTNDELEAALFPKGSPTPGVPTENV